jgi:hypothetical protein
MGSAVHLCGIVRAALIRRIYLGPDLGAGPEMLNDPVGRSGVDVKNDFEVTF